jgi:RimJ/RimL family protein N-acetyltransferase
MKSELRSVSVTRDNESKFYDYIGDNFAEYFFFHVDYAQYPDDTEIIMALDKEDSIHGMVLNWKKRRIQLRGSLESVDFLLKDKLYSPISITGFEMHKGLIDKFFPQYSKFIPLYRMGMKKGAQKDLEKYPYQILSLDHREQIASLMRIADPIFWGDREPEHVEIDENNSYYGIFQENDLICITGLWKYENVGYVTVVGTHPDHWNKGLASSLISSVLKELFMEKEQCLITVRVENPPAIHAYEKLGFRICNTQYSYEKEAKT